MCGKNPATRGDNEWGHMELCCSNECGHAYKDSRQRAHRNIARLVEERDKLTQLIAMWTRQLDGRDGGGCDLFSRGKPMGDCDGDGHYECKECVSYSGRTAC